MNRALVRHACAAIIAPLILFARSIGAQDPRIADSLLRRGAVERAESEYYAAAAARPRDPEARFALGQYLIARGALRIGATLIDEAARFGYDRARASAALGRVYQSLGAYDDLLRLPGYAFAPGQRAWFTWLSGHPERASAPDSIALVSFQRAAVDARDASIGSMSIRVNGVRAVARVSGESGCTVRVADTSAAARSLRVFPPAAVDSTRRLFAAADSLALNHLQLSNVAMTRERLSTEAAIICMELLARYAPTFDPRAGTVALHVTGSATAPLHASMAMPLLDRDGSYHVLFNGAWASLDSPAVMRYLRDRRWTFDLRRRQVTIDP